MVRHEAAEAIGSIAHPKVLSKIPHPQTIPLLQSFLNDKEPVVRESCRVALDILEAELTGFTEITETN